MSGASQIVITLKNKIKVHNFLNGFWLRELSFLKELDDQLKDFETKAGDNKESYNNEKKLADEVEAELLSRQRKVNIKFF